VGGRRRRGPTVQHKIRRRSFPEIADGNDDRTNDDDDDDNNGGIDDGDDGPTIAVFDDAEEHFVAKPDAERRQPVERQSAEQHLRRSQRFSRPLGPAGLLHLSPAVPHRSFTPAEDQDTVSLCFFGLKSWRHETA